MLGTQIGRFSGVFVPRMQRISGFGPTFTYLSLHPSIRGSPFGARQSKGDETGDSEKEVVSTVSDDDPDRSRVEAVRKSTSDTRNGSARHPEDASRTKHVVLQRVVEQHPTILHGPGDESHRTMAAGGRTAYNARPTTNVGLRPGYENRHRSDQVGETADPEPEIADMGQQTVKEEEPESQQIKGRTMADQGVHSVTTRVLEWSAPPTMLPPRRSRSTNAATPMRDESTLGVDPGEPVQDSITGSRQSKMVGQGLSLVFRDESTDTTDWSSHGTERDRQESSPPENMRSGTENRWATTVTGTRRDRNGSKPSSHDAFGSTERDPREGSRGANVTDDPLTDIDVSRLADRLYRELERKYRIERERRGL